MSPYVLVPLRAIAMFVCAVATTVAAIQISRAVLPFAANLQQTFGRLDWAVFIGVPAGVALGTLLTHPLGRGTFDAATRVRHAVVAILLVVMVIAGLMMAGG